jgi:hypothetical protein
MLQKIYAMTCQESGPFQTRLRKQKVVLCEQACSRPDSPSIKIKQLGPNMDLTRLSEPGVAHHFRSEPTWNVPALQMK